MNETEGQRACGDWGDWYGVVDLVDLGLAPYFRPPIVFRMVMTVRHGYVYTSCQGMCELDCGCVSACVCKCGVWRHKFGWGMRAKISSISV